MNCNVSDSMASAKYHQLYAYTGFLPSRIPYVVPRGGKINLEHMYLHQGQRVSSSHRALARYPPYTLK